MKSARAPIFQLSPNFLSSKVRLQLALRRPVPTLSILNLFVESGAKHVIFVSWAKDFTRSTCIIGASADWGGEPPSLGWGAGKFTTGGMKCRPSQCSRTQSLHVVLSGNWILSVSECNILLFKMKVFLSKKTELDATRIQDWFGEPKYLHQTNFRFTIPVLSGMHQTDQIFRACVSKIDSNLKH